MDDYVDSLIARGVISNDAAARMMTHWPQQPEERLETSPPPYRDDAVNFLHGGIYDVLKGRGVETPDWMDRLHDVTHSEAFNDALGVVGPIKTPAWTAARLARLSELRKLGRSPQQIANDIGLSRKSVESKMYRMDVGEPAGSDYFVTPEETTRLKELMDQGKSYGEMGKELGIPRDAARSRVRAIKEQQRLPPPEPDFTDAELAEYAKIFGMRK